MKKKREDTARLRKINDSAKECADVIVHNSAGRPPKYHEHFVHMIDVLAEGLVSSTNWQLAKMFGVRDSGTIERWEKEHPSFSEAIQRGRAKVDQQLEEALRHRANGYSHPEEKIFCTPTGAIRRVATTMHYPPDTKALQFWLGNRNPNRWKSKQEDQSAIPAADAAADLRAALAEIDNTTQGGKSK